MKLLDQLNRAIVILSSIALIVAGAVLTYSVILRNFSPEPTDWQDEFSVFLLVSVTFGASAWVQSERGHIGIEAVRVLLPPRVEHARRVLVDVLSTLFCAFFAWKSWTLFYEAWSEGYTSATSWGPPLWIPYVAMSLGMSLLTLQVFVQVFRKP